MKLTKTYLKALIRECINEQAGDVTVQHNIVQWLEKAKKHIEDSSKANSPNAPGNHLTLGWNKGQKWYMVFTNRIDGGLGKSAYCFIDMSGNIYKPAAWGKPAKGIRGTVFSVDPTKIDYLGGWLYRRYH